MEGRILGIHHVTAIAGNPQQNLDFYAGVLGMRLVKRSVNQDDPGTYHLFFADAAGSPGSDLTFFPWTRQAPSREGVGLTVEVSLAVGPGSLDFWERRLQRHGARLGRREERFGEPSLPLLDPHGLKLALVETADREDFAPWERGGVPAEHQIRGIHGVRLWEASLALTADFLEGTLDFRAAGEEAGWHRYGVSGGGSGRMLEVRELPGERRGAWGTGSIHHVAWRVEDHAAELAVRERIRSAARRPTEVIDRFWFQSVYFTEPGGVIFELATDGPGFTADEDPATLGERLILPPWLEPHRSRIEAVLPPIELPDPIAP